MRGGIARGLSSVKCLVIVLCIAFPSAESFAPPLSRLARTRGRVSSTRARSLSLGVRKGRQDDTTGFNLSNLSNLSETQRGLAVLTTVPLAWGTFEPAIRFVYTTEPQIPGIVFNLGFYAVALSTLSILASLIEDDDDTSWPVVGGMELGSYLFAGNVLQTIGLKTVPSDKAAFLLQLTTVFVPLGAALMARSWASLSSRTWLCCFVALLGVGVMGMDGKEPSGSDAQLSTVTDALSAGFGSFGLGELFIVAAAVAYTFHCLRLEVYAQSTSAIRLATCKAATETLLSAAALVSFLSSASFGVLLSAAPGKEVREFASQIPTLELQKLMPAGLAMLWTGWVPVAYTIVAQSYGQSRVRPVAANLIYTIQPICTALVAYLALGESLGPLGYAGGALIGGAVLLATTEGVDDDAKA